ncbi:MAG: UDP-glucose--hexose-1-phosphate uridylyltransferase [Tenacibaculum sp.]
MIANLQNTSHRRYNILTQEWVLVSPQRAKRPWQGQQEEILNKKLNNYSSSCYLCAGNVRAGGKINPKYRDVFIFDNDFPALQKNNSSFDINDGLIKAQSEQGICKVICFSPNHSKSLADMTLTDIEKVVKAWQQQYNKQKSIRWINYVQIFENKGTVMGCSNPHPHGQIWSQQHLPNEIIKKDYSQKKHYAKYNSSLLGAYLKQEINHKERIVFKNKDFVVLVPFWAVWPYETMIIPKKQQPSISKLNKEQRNSFAQAISVVTKTYDKLFNCSFPYSSGIHQAPTTVNSHEHWHWHMSFYPPLLRSATVKKFMVGYEMFGMPQRDITAEMATKALQKIIQTPSL